MKDLNWFQARDLAEQGRAIRRDGWTYWLIKRFFVWIITEVDSDTGVEVRHVVQNTDFRDSEFLAKDWTDEPWSGATYPPCATPGPATDLAPNSTGGAGGWTVASGRCGGDGEGGNIPAENIDTTGVYFLPPPPPPRWRLNVYAGTMVPNVLGTNSGAYVRGSGFERLVPDGTSCWQTSPRCTFFFYVSANPDAVPPFNDAAGKKVAIIIAPPGQTLASAPVAGGVFGGGVAGLVTFGPWDAAEFTSAWVPSGMGPEFSTYFAGGATLTVNNWGTQLEDRHTYGIHTGETPVVVPGGTYQFRAVNYVGATGFVLSTADTSYTFAPSCF
jgi:hypothetical protein